MNASPFGNQLTMFWSSFFSISINFLGNGLECPVDEDPGLDAADNAGDAAGLARSRGDLLLPVSYTHLTLPTICSV